MPTVTLSSAEINADTKVVDLLVSAGVTKSKSESRRLIESGAISINDAKITAIDAVIGTDSPFILHKGKKVHLRVVIE